MIKLSGHSNNTKGRALRASSGEASLKGGGLPSWLYSLFEWGVMLLILFLSTVLGFLFHYLEFTEANTITVYILGVLITALVTRNYICSGVFSLLSVLLFNFFFTEPRLSFVAYESGYPVTFAIMLICSLITGTLANRVATSARISANAAYRTDIMLKTAQLFQRADSEDAVITALSEQLVRLLSKNVAVFKVDSGELSDARLFFAVGGEFPLRREDKEEATRIFKSAAEGLLCTQRAAYYRIRALDKDIYFVGIYFGAKGLEGFEEELCGSILGEAELTLESLYNAKGKEDMAIIAKNEQLRANILRAISHDLRTPLTSISGNAENLLTNYDSIDKSTRLGLITDLNDDAQWLIFLVENLLSVSRISEGRMNINMSSQLADEVITEALKHVGKGAKDHIISTEFSDGILLAKMDARLITQVIINLVDNAIKYTPKGSQIKISAKISGQNIEISVSDNGDGIPDRHKEDVFKMFYTGEHSVADCRRSLGLGLSLCQSIVVSHGSTLTLSDNIPSGCIFKFNLSKSEVDLCE